MSRRTKQRSRAGLTLLELMLAMSLSGLLLYAIGMAVDLHLRTLEQRRNMIEQSRVARGIMRQIASDLKRVVMRYEQDLSALEILGQGSAAEALAALAAIESGDENAAAAAIAGAAGGAAGAGGGGAAGGDEGQGGEAGAAGGGEAGAEGDAGMEGAAEEEESAYTGDIANATALPPEPGLYGNQYQLQLDIARIPRFDEMIQQQATEVGEIVDLVSDVKNVAYYIQQESAGQQMNGATDVFKDSNVTGGLVRRQLDRSITDYAMANNNATAVQRAGEIIAPEIMGLEFRYFDGLEWLYEWDSEMNGGLPMAVEIIMLVRPVNDLNVQPVVMAPVDVENRDLLTFRTIVRIPTAKATFMDEEDTESSEDLEALGL